ncbi:MAG: hypothetical protein DDG59_06000 [Anaerolineae bacterium]|jgi:hypothetical protein|nr:MAG: hypothetical protein DDG59_06000 [Anaerolineae bacterium]
MAVAATPTLAYTPTPMPTFGSTVSVVFVPDQQSLPVLASPQSNADVVGYLEANQTNLTASGNYRKEGDDLWVEIGLPQGGMGWVKADYLTTTIPADQFCSNPQIQGFTDQILTIFSQKDGQRLAAIVSPIHGLRLRTHWSNAEVFLGDRQILDGLFQDTTTYTFGVEKFSQQPIQGTFQEVVYPLLMDVFEGGMETCNTLDQGLAADWVSGYIQWPFEYANLNYLARFRPAPAQDELNWRMWAFGIEWVNQQPTLTVMVHYQWDF